MTRTRIPLSESEEASRDLQLKLEEGQETDVTGIEMLLADCHEAISLTPEENQRMERRDDN